MIKIKNLSKKYNDTVIFDKTDYTFPKKGMVCVIGASGSGKSTLLNLLAGFDSKYDGTIMMGNITLNQLNRDQLCRYRKRHIGFIFQDYHLLHGYTVLENILISSEVGQKSFSNDKNKAVELLENVGLADKQDEKVENLSGGQKQRVAIVRALMGNPSVILGDEVTGALDRKNSTEIMNILKEISNSRLVIVITHDKKICSFAGEVIAIEEGKIVTSEKQTEGEIETESFGSLRLPRTRKAAVWKRGMKSFKVNAVRYFAVALAISIGISCFILSLSSRNVINQSIDEFKKKNTAFNNGYIQVEKDNTEKMLKILRSDARIDNIYKQYKIENISLKLGDQTEQMQEKYPISKASQKMSYGSMPKKNEKQIALSPSLAKKFSKNIQQLIGNKIVVQYKGVDYTLEISGIFNAEFDDFIVSSDIEQMFYQDQEESAFSVSYDVIKFDHIVPVNKMLKDNGIYSKDASSQVGEFQTTFRTIHRLFLIVSAFVLAIGLFISIILLSKLQRSRYKEVGLLSALGFSYGTIRNIIMIESILLSGAAFTLNLLWMLLCVSIGRAFHLPVLLSTAQIIGSSVLTFLLIEIISILTSRRLIHTDPAVALRE